MMTDCKHFKVTDRQTGDVSFVKVADHPSKEGYDHSTHTFARLAREPEEHDIIMPGGRIERCETTRARIDREAELALMSRSEFVDHILALVDARLKPD